MSIKDLFEKPVSIENASTSSMKVESDQYVIEAKKRNETFQPFIDFSSASNFAKFGSAYEYYTEAIERVYNYYPYDGSEKEKIQFEISSSYLDKYIFDKKYPKSTGYINFSYGGWGTGTPDAQGYGNPASADREYIYIRGGLHTASAGMEGTPLYKTFEDSVLYDESKLRTKSFVLDVTKGWTVEFWLKKEDFDTSKSEREVILDLWNNNAAGSDYGRVTLSLNGGPALNGLNSFNLTVRSGSLASGKGIFEQTICDSAFHTSSLSTWGHYALSVVSESSGLITRFYVNGDLNRKVTHNAGGTMGNIDGRINGYIGSLIAATSHASPSSQYSGKLSASLDDFRFWKTKRTSEEIYDNWKIQARGGTNTDDANVELGLYYKFNEGIVGDANTDATVLDYSGRIINGSWTGYSAGARNTGSAFVSSSLVSKEHEDPIIYKDHPDVKYVLSQMQTSGSLWDDINPTLLYNTVPEWIRDEDLGSNSNVKYLYQVMASYFDTLYAQIRAVPTLQNNAYPSASYKALPFAKRLLESRGFMTQNIFVESDLLELFGERDSNQVLFEERLQEVKNIIYTNLYNNLNFIYKSKGTEKSIRNALRCFGIDDEIIKLNVYTDGGTHYFNDKYKQSSLNKKYINFNSSSLFGGTVVLTSSAINANSFITGSAYAKNERFSAFTAEADIMVPHKLERGEKGHFDTSFLSSSIFGMHRPKEASNGHTWSSRLNDVSNFQVYLARRTKESEDAYFVLRNRSKTINVTSSTFTRIYDNQRWNLAVRVKPDKYPFIGNVVTSSNPTYTIELYGVTHDYDDVRHEFTISSSMSYASGSSFLSDPKGFYLGSHRENFTGSLQEQSDIMAGGFRYYLDYLDNGIIKQHNLDPTNYGLRKSYQSPTLFSRNLNKQLPSADITAVNFDFSNVTTSDSGGKFIVEDLSSGSTDTVYEWADAIIRREHRGLGFGFPVSSKKVIENEHIFSMRKELPEISFTSNNVFIKGDNEENFIKDDDVSDNFYTLEKSMGQIISDEMLNMFSSVKEMNNLIGKASERYRMEYKGLQLLKRLFFERNTGDLDFDRFTQYFKWIDSSISQMISQLYPISVRHSEGISNIIESHMLERDKYDNKFPLLESYHGAESSLKAHAEMNYNWKYGHAPLPDSERDNCLWNKERKKRTDITQRETIRKSILNWNNATAISASTTTGAIYELPTYHIRKLAKPYAVSHKFARQIHGGINYPYNKDRDHMFNAIMRHGKKTALGIPINVVLVGQGQGLGLVQPQKCDDVYNPNKKDRLNVTVAVGRYAGGGFNAYPINDSEAYTFRTDMAKMPFTLISQSVNTGGYLAKVSASYDSGVIITNLHSDTTDFTNEVPMQGPFAESWVGGHQARHVDINRRDTTLRDDDVGGAPPNNLHNQYTRPEAWRFLFGERDTRGAPTGSGAFGFAGFDYGGPYPDPARKPAIFYRGLRAKRPFNLRNIKTTTGSIKHGNYYQNYELMSVSGKHRNNFYFRKNSEISNYLPYSIASTLPQTTHPMTLIGHAPLVNGNVFGTHSNNMQPDTAAFKNVHTLNDTLLGGSKNKTAITSRFSAPGGPEIQTKGYLDTYSHEYSIHNALPYRNLTVRSSGSGESGTMRATDIHGNRSGLLTHLRRHSGKFGSDSVLGSVTSEGYVTIPSFHKIHRNVMRKPTSESQLSSPVFNEDHNNGFFQSPIPQSDYQYSWLTGSLGSNYGIRSGKQRIYGYAPRDGELVDTEIDQSVNFSAANSYIEIGTDSTWNALVGQGSSNRTMACAFWFKRTRESISHDQRILSFSYRDLQISMESDKLKIESDWSTTDGVWYSKPTFELDRWYHIVIIYDAQSASNDPVLYVNGELRIVQETSTPAGSLAALSGQACFIGNNYFKTQAFRGHLDNFAIFNDGLSAANVAVLYNNGDRFREYTYKTNMVLYYRMGVGGYKGLTRFRDDTTSNFYDISGGGRNSTDAANLSFTINRSFTVYSAINFPTASEIFGE